MNAIPRSYLVNVVFVHSCVHNYYWWNIYILVCPLISLTVFASCVEALDVVIEADSYRCKGHLSLQAGHQAVIEWPRPLCPHHGADRPKHTTITDVLGSFYCHLLTLDLNTKQEKAQIREYVGNLGHETGRTALLGLLAKYWILYMEHMCVKGCFLEKKNSPVVVASAECNVTFSCTH